MSAQSDAMALFRRNKGIRGVMTESDMKRMQSMMNYGAKPKASGILGFAKRKLQQMELNKIAKRRMKGMM